MLETGRILLLENGKEYVIVCSVKYENNDYVYLANLNDSNETKVCKYKDNIVKEVDNDILPVIEKLLIDNLSN